MLKIAIVGPESSGKTTLAEALATYYDEPWVSEYSRPFLGDLGRAYEERDLLSIARGQCMAEDDVAERVKRIELCDTDMVTIRIWSEEVYGRCAAELVALSEQRHYDHWLLCAPDMPWEPDPLRENPHDRDRLFDVYDRMLRSLGKPYTVMAGGREERLVAAVRAIDRSLA